MKLKKSINEIEKLIGYSFNKKKYLSHCLIHPSFYKNDKKKRSKNNHYERLEFLGDRVLNLSVASLITMNSPGVNQAGTVSDPLGLPGWLAASPPSAEY